MSSLAEVYLWGTRIGAVLLEDGRETAGFEYDPGFLASGIELSPVVMPARTQVYSFPDLARETFHGLPGLLADSLPDRFGNALLDAWLERRGRPAMNAVERLCYTGSRGMGALEYKPATGPENDDAARIDVAEMTGIADAVLGQRRDLEGVLDRDAAGGTLLRILRVGTSAGGARAKAVVAWNRETDEVRSGQVPVSDGFEHWLLKFDGVRGNRDRELADPAGYGAIEYAYYLMARKAGIAMSECRLLEEGGRRHFMTRRFDRGPDGDKVHMQTLGALAHFDYNLPGAYAYEQAFALIRQLGLGAGTAEKLFRRMTFNIVARNQDDHVKNIAFLMDRRGAWSLAPAYDVTYSYQPDGAWTGRHQMSMNGKRDGFTMADFKAAAAAAGLKRGAADRCQEAVRAAVRSWPEFAGTAGVGDEIADAIAGVHRLNM